MTTRLVMEEEKFYIAVQDGRYDNNEYDTYKEAVEARDKLPDFCRKGTYITSTVYQRKFLESQNK